MKTRLKQLRKEQKISQMELESRTGIEQALISKFENGKRVPLVHQLVILADYYGVSIDYILERTERREIAQDYSEVE